MEEVEDQVSDLAIVLFDHDDVAVAEDSQLRGVTPANWTGTASGLTYAAGQPCRASYSSGGR